ncbi:ABC transporter family protein [Brevibacillus sp. AG162]|uniref:ATP-binding cassette domain-containing protein n=1 Tax=Brevibacillus sp. AG162 TaxID=2572910 RepID=UPI00116A65AF|nr:ABC transporter family protein [Brevibacillus sp. AG162]
MPFIAETKNVERTFGRGAAAVRALAGVEMRVESGRLLVLKGRSGSGKTTLLNLLGGLDRPTVGSVYFQGREIGQLSDHERTRIRRKNMAFIFQSFGLLPLMSAAENVEFGLRLSGVPAAEWKERVRESLDIVGLSKRAHHRPFEMSGENSNAVRLPELLRTGRHYYWRMSRQLSWIVKRVCKSAACFASWSMRVL